jgi:diaminopimelate epimerase
MHFFKYQGTGNDFVLLDNRDHRFDGLTTERIARLCDRRFGIGADGLMLLENQPGYDFRMVYYNSDGRESSMCGNGGRCIAAFAQRLGVVDEKARFLAVDGPHEATIRPTGEFVELKMSDAPWPSLSGDHAVVDTGSPHYVRFCSDIHSLNVPREGKAVRFSPAYAQEGINVNFLLPIDETAISLRTYERGVEDETLSCGTGATAAALSYYAAGKTTARQIAVHTPGGTLQVRFAPHEGGFGEIWLCGPATFVFEGKISVKL